MNSFINSVLKAPLFMLLSLSLLVFFAISADAGTQEIYEQVVLKNSTRVNDDGTYYANARAELPEHWYVLYRVLERISRANNLDDLPWQIEIRSDYGINAHASGNNRLVLGTEILEQTTGDTSAIACLVGHELAHHIHEHVSEQNLFSYQVMNELGIQVESDSRREELSRQIINDLGLYDTVEDLIRGIGPLGNTVRRFLDDLNIPVGGSIFGRPTSRRERDNEALGDFQNQRLQLIRRHEMEADATGLEFSVKAGFEPEGCLRFMKMFARIPGSRTSPFHPSIDDRIAMIEQLASSPQLSSLVLEGEANMARKTPLTYDFFNSRSSSRLRVNSMFGSADQDLERLFGQ